MLLRGRRPTRVRPNALQGATNPASLDRYEWNGAADNALSAAPFRCGQVPGQRARGETGKGQ
jgi:hypothetical protein